jgi:hypothetical protein
MHGTQMHEGQSRQSPGRHSGVKTGEPTGLCLFIERGKS